MKTKQIVYMSLEDAKSAYDKYSDGEKKIWAIVVYKNGYASIVNRDSLKFIKLQDTKQ